MSFRARTRGTLRTRGQERKGSSFCKPQSVRKNKIWSVFTVQKSQPERHTFPPLCSLLYRPTFFYGAVVARSISLPVVLSICFSCYFFPPVRTQEDCVWSLENGREPDSQTRRASLIEKHAFSISRTRCTGALEPTRLEPAVLPDLVLITMYVPP